jgi:hypothetical membrane protein
MRQGIETAALLGGIAPFITYACILLSIASYKEFSWTHNALSDLGIVPGITMTLFNSGLIIGGFLFTIFAIGLFFYLRKNTIGKIGSLLFILACISIVLVGIFNEHYKPTHFIVSVMLFSFMALSLLVISGNFIFNGEKRLGLFTLSLGLAAALIWILEYTIWYFPHVAIPEFVSGLLGVTWVLVMVRKMLKSKPD